MANKEKVVKTDKQKKPGFFAKLGKFFKDLKSEFKKITWSNVKTTTKNFGIVLVVLIIFAVVIGLFDWGLTELLKLLGNLSK